MNGAIPLDWIKQYIEKLIKLAGEFDEGSKMRESTLLRADHVMDMVEAWKETR